jgi:hypothetical protein
MCAIFCYYLYLINLDVNLLRIHICDREVNRSNLSTEAEHFSCILLNIRQMQIHVCLKRAFSFYLD